MSMCGQSINTQAGLLLPNIMCNVVDLQRTMIKELYLFACMACFKELKDRLHVKWHLLHVDVCVIDTVYTLFSAIQLLM